MENELLTDFQKRQIARNNMIVAKYREMRKQYPNAANNRIYEAMAKDVDYSAQGIRLLLIRRGIVKTRPRSGRTKSERV